MLRGISPLIGPDLLATLHRMGHGDTIVLADAHFPGHSVNPHTLRADGLRIPALLEAILPLFVLDTYVPSPVALMNPVPGDTADPTVEASYRDCLTRQTGSVPGIARLERQTFYEAARSAFCVVMTGDTAKYANLLLTKGVTPV
ncbi:MAG: L-fucose mutarotase [Verrucomicrobiales bacterium]|nr:L-fucose mutarotase [Verrucomicrobiales bacterium]